MSDEHIFLVDTLRNDFRSSILRKDKLMPPKNDDLVLLVLKLNRVRDYVELRRGAWAALDKCRAAVEKATQVIVDHGKELVEETRRGADFFMGSELGPDLEVDLEIVESLYKSAIAAHNRPGLFALVNQNVKPIGEHWHNYAETLFEFFRDAMAGANPGVPIGISNGGPAARFISHVIQNITGDSVRAQTVSDHLKKSRSSRGDVNDVTAPG